MYNHTDTHDTQKDGKNRHTNGRTCVVEALSVCGRVMRARLAYNLCRRACLYHTRHVADCDRQRVERQTEAGAADREQLAARSGPGID